MKKHGETPDKSSDKDKKVDIKALKKTIAYERHEVGIKIIEKQLHKGWITKIKYYPDLNYVVSSSLDGFIHIHKIDLTYEENRTFNLH
jgi:WD40 repeat protein